MGEMPEEWKNGSLPIYKKCDKQKVKNYTGIRVFKHVINHTVKF